MSVFEAKRALIPLGMVMLWLMAVDIDTEDTLGYGIMAVDIDTEDTLGYGIIV